MSIHLIQNGRIFDGTGSPPVVADVLLEDDRVAAVGPGLAAPASARRVDARGLDVLPGGIDVHSHDDVAILETDGCEPKLRQGFTTTVLGNCGHGCAPSSPGRALAAYSQPVLGPFPETKWPRFADYLEHLASEPRLLNHLALVPHAPLRSSVMGMERRPASSAEIADMCTRLDEALTAGAAGMSLGIMYSPGNAATLEELVALTAVVERHDGIVAAHIRNESDQILQSLEEFLELGVRTGVHLQVSHVKLNAPRNFGRMPEVFALLDDHRSRGVDVSVDVYPYEAGSSTVATVMPPFTADRGNESLMEALRDPELRRRIVEELQVDWDSTGIENFLFSLGPDSLRLTGFNRPENAAYEGESVAAIATMRGTDPIESLLDLVESESGDIRVLLVCIDPGGIEVAIEWPWCYLGSDGLPSRRGTVHPRLYGSLPRYLNRYTGEGKVLSRAEGIKRFTMDPAIRFGVPDRGVIRPGAFADVIIVDEDGPFDRATFENPRMSPEGVHYVFVAGVPVLAPGIEAPAGLHGGFLRSAGSGATLPGRSSPG